MKKSEIKKLEPNKKKKKKETMEEDGTEME